MRYVRVEWDGRSPGFHLDATAYLAELPRLRPHLPPGAWRFCADPDHYRFGSRRCVKDLGLSAITVPGTRDAATTIEFTPNAWKHDEGLTLAYTGVTRIEVERRREIDWMAQDTVMLDEILPHEDGCRHEITLADSTIVIHSADLHATWTPV